MVSRLGLLTSLSVAFSISFTRLAALAASCGSIHAVASGEGCWSIYTDAGLTQAQLLALNPGLDCNVLMLGQQVCVAPPCSKFYTVASGDYCFKIETEQSISDAGLMTLNPGLSCDELFPGQNLCVAAPTASATPTATSTTPTAASTTLATTTPVETSTVTVPSTTPVPTPTVVPCGRQIPVSEGDTCYNLATEGGLQLSQFMALNQDLNCTNLQAGDIACVKVPCSLIYKVQSGDWCAKIETDNQIASNQLTELNPGLSCDTLAPDLNVCVKPADPDETTTYVPPIDPYPALSPGTTVPQSPILAFASAEGNARSTFYGETIFQSDSQHLAAFAKNDKNGDGKLDHDELEAMMSMDPTLVRGISNLNNTLTADNLVTEMLNSADLNNDGSIDQDEFLFAIRQVQNATNAITEIANDNTAVGERRRGLGAIVAAIAAVVAVIGLAIANLTFFFSMLAQNELFRGNDLLSYLDVAYWDGSKYHTSAVGMGS
ncbi:hypothetical protein FRC10_008070 [Ceratobasidium sp. 414]|nr:hypothetical protein FRC10_008070 [Ceratobasidium sp. 414]